METIYLNQAGTSWPKPACVRSAVAATLESDPRISWSDAFDESLAKVAGFLGIQDTDRLLLTPGCTSALALAVESHAWQSGDRVITSGIEHHALHRPLLQLERLGVQLEVIPPTRDSPMNLNQVEDSLRRGNVRLIAITAASNVTGDLLPVEKVTELAKRYNALTLVDGAQTVGWLDYDLSDSGIDLFTFGGHKGLHGVWGIGGLYAAPTLALQTYEAACTIPAADVRQHDLPSACVPMPGYCDGGSVDRCALAGLAAATEWLSQSSPMQASFSTAGSDAVPTTPAVERLITARGLVKRLQNGLEAFSEIEIYAFAPADQRLPTLAFNVDGLPSSQLARRLAEHGIVIGSGLQCAPLAHEHLGTLPDGVARLSVGPANNRLQIENTLAILRDIIEAKDV